MKKAFIIIAFLLVFALTACGGGKDSPVAADETSSDSSSAVQQAPEPEPEPLPEPLFDMGDLQLLQIAGKYQEEVPGMYDGVYLYNGGGTRLIDDFTNLTQKAFCTIEGCTHKDESCEAVYIQPEVFDRNYIVGDKIYRILSYNAYYDSNSFHLPNPVFERSPVFKIEKWELDLSGYELLLEIENSRIIMTNTVINDGKALYLDIGNSSDDPLEDPAISMDTGESFLIRFDLTSGEITKLRDMKNRSLFGVGGREMLIWTLPEDNEDPKGMIAYSPEFDEERELPMPPDDVQPLYSSKNAPFYKDWLYYSLEDENSGTTALMRYLCSTGESEEMAVFETTSLSVQGIIDNEVMAVCKDGDTREYFYVNAESKEVKNIPLSYTYYGDIYPCEIVATWQGNYIVKNGALTDKGEMNPFPPVETMRPAYAMISKDDYWAGEANFTEFQMFPPVTRL